MTDQVSPVGDSPAALPCACCGYTTPEELGDWPRCRICGWQPDGANRVTLAEAQAYYATIRASDPRLVSFVRWPTVAEVRAARLRQMEARP